MVRSLLLVLMLSSPAWAQVLVDGNCPTGNCPQQTQVAPRYAGVSTDVSKWPCVCEITIYGQPSGGQRIDVHGSGVLIAKASDSSVVLTAAHNLRGAAGHVIQVRFPASRENFTATILSVDNTSDAASLTLSGVPSVHVATLADDAPLPGEHLTLAGFGGSPRKGFAATAARALRVADGGLMFAGRPSSQGDSGGPVFDSSGRVCGLITMSSESETVIVCGRRGERLRPLRCLIGDILRAPLALLPRQPRTDIRINLPPPATTVPPPSTPTLIEPDIPSVPQTPVVPETPAIEPVDTEEIVAMVLERIKNDPTFRGPEGPVGPVGPVGPTGPAGPKGEPGSAAQIDTIALAEAIRRALPPIHVRSVLGKIGADGKLEIGPNGKPIIVKVLDTEEVPLDGTLNLFHVPLRSK